MTSTESAMSSRDHVMHGQAVADADDPELQGRAAGQAHTGGRGLGDFIQVDVTRDEFIKGIGNADEWPVYLLIRQAHGFEKRPMRIFFQA